MTALKDLIFRRLDRNELNQLIAWAAAEGWNPGKYDADAFYATDPAGFYGIFLGNEMLGGGSLVAYSHEFGFMGFFIIRPDVRGMGIGQHLWYLRRDTLLARLHKGAPIGMDGVITMQPFYGKGGFKIAFRDERYEFIGQMQSEQKNVVPYEKKHYDQVQKIDQHCFGYNREVFLKAWLQLPESKTYVALQNGVVCGFATIRKAQTGYKIGPLFAENEIAAEALFSTCLQQFPDEKCYLDIPVSNPAALALVKKYNGKYVFECARMYYGNAPELPISKIYGITTFELG